MGSAPVLLGLEPARAGGSPCFAHQLKRCRGACCGKESIAAHNLRLAQALQALRPYARRQLIVVFGAIVAFVALSLLQAIYGINAGSFR